MTKWKTLMMLLLTVALGAVVIATEIEPTRAMGGLSPLLGEIVLLPYDFTPPGYWPCDGSLLSVSQYTPLYSLLGNRFGGNGVNNFAVPDLRGAEPAPHVRYFIAVQGLYPADYSFFDYVGEICLLPYDDSLTSRFSNLTHCDGKLMPIPQNTALFSLLGTTYGGDGQTSFGIPDLRRAEPHPGLKYYISLIGLFPPRE